MVNCTLSVPENVYVAIRLLWIRSDVLVIEILEMLRGNFSSHVAMWGGDLKVFSLNFVLLPQCGNKSVCCLCSLLISDVDS